MLSSHDFARWLALAAFLCLLAAAGLFWQSDARTQHMLANSLTLAGGACAMALPLGTALAVVIARTDALGRRAAAMLLGALLLLPLYVQLAGWDALAGKNGWYTLAYGSIGEPWLSGMTAAVWVHGMAAVPWVALIVGAGLRLVEPELEEAALLDAGPFVVLLRVSLPQAAPFVLAAAMWVAVGTTSEMTVTNIYLVSTYTEELYLSLSLSPDASEATLQVLPGIALLLLLVCMGLAILARLMPRVGISSVRRTATIRLYELRLPASLWMWLTVLLLFGVPAISLAYKAGVEVQLQGAAAVRYWSGEKFVAVLGLVLRRFQDDYLWTALIAAGAATVALLAAAVLAWLARDGNWRALPASLATALCLAVPGPLVAIALIELMNRPSIGLLVWLYDDTIAAPLVAQMVRALPIALLVLWPALRTISGETLAAAALDGAGRWTTLLLIVLPARRGAFAVAWLAAAAVAAGDLGHSLLVIPPGMETIQRRIFGLVHSGVEEQVAGVCLLMMGAYFGVAILLDGLLRRENRRSSDRA